MKKLKINDHILEFCVTGMDDAADIFEIENECFSSGWSQKLVIDEISNKNSISFVCKSDGKVVGYIFIRYLFEEGEIFKVCVKPDFRKMKIASELMEMSLDFAFEKGVEKCFLEVRKSNINAISLYEKFGFSVYAQRNNYYADNGEDALLMQKDMGL